MWGSGLHGITFWEWNDAADFFLPKEFEYDKRLAVLQDKSEVKTWLLEIWKDCGEMPGI